MIDPSPDLPTTADWLQRASDALHSRVEAEALLMHVTGRSRSTLFAWPEAPIAQNELAALEPLLSRRLAGEPLAYILGEREFWSLPLFVDKRVLVPRHDTEVLVEEAIAAYRKLDIPLRPNSINVLDLGTGSGAIAIALATELKVPVLAVDRSAAALAVAAKNTKHLANGQVLLVQADWCDAIASSSVALIVSNPPYIKADDPHLLTPELQHEPVEALVSGQDGMDDIRHLAHAVTRVARVGARLLIEHGHDQAAAVTSVLTHAGYVGVTTTRDLGGNDRVTAGTWPGRAE